MERRSSGEERNGLLRLLSLELLFADEVCAGLLSDDKLLAAMARFEAALARASSRHGLVPAAHAEVIFRVCEAARFDARALAREGRAGTLAIPFVKQLTAQVAAVSKDAAKHVHSGATSQDVIDTATVLCLKPACARVDELTVRLGDAAASLARRHGQTRTAARTLLQPALPVPFGWKAAVWLSLIGRCVTGMRRAANEAFTLQFGGPSGTLSAFGEQGAEISATLAEELDLRASVVPWHSARDGFARIGAELAILAGAAGKIGRDVSLLMQQEVGEASEAAAPGRGGSSSMPHKRNPALSMLALEAAQRTPGLAATLLGQLTPEHERGLGQWQSQWFTLRELACATASGVAAMADVLEGLEVNEKAMRENLEVLLKDHAQDSFGAAAAMIDSALAEWTTARGKGP
ncbi:MAG TPA: lyase family protein [Burkholderiales bacterium]|nr:lyase family protein [Burkholderiales bacterium]